MIKAEMSNNDVLHITTSEIRLMDLVIYNGKGYISIHHMTNEDATNIIRCLQAYKETLKEEK